MSVAWPVDLETFQEARLAGLAKVSLPNWPQVEHGELFGLENGRLGERASLGCTVAAGSSSGLDGDSCREGCLSHGQYKAFLVISLPFSVIRLLIITAFFISRLI